MCITTQQNFAWGAAVEVRPMTEGEWPQWHFLRTATGPIL